MKFGRVDQHIKRTIGNKVPQREVGKKLNPQGDICHSQFVSMGVCVSFVHSTWKGMARTTRSSTTFQGWSTR